MSQSSASDRFDPCHRWLGLPEGSGKPTHYRLLGIASNERSDEIIIAAADRQTHFVRGFLEGEYAEAARRILYEIEEAKVCLLSTKLRREYDASLRERQAKRGKKKRGVIVPDVFSGGSTVGEESGLPGDYFKIVSILLVAFVCMAAASFLLPWQEVIFDQKPAVPVAKNEVKDPQPQAQPAEQPAKQPAQPAPPAKQAVKTPERVTNSVGMEFRLVPAGQFLMGLSKPVEEVSKLFPNIPMVYLNAERSHPVQLTKPFYIGTTEVTQAQWKSVMGTEPWQDKREVKAGSDYAACYISWHDAVEFCRKLSETEGIKYRLPTEAEWEYACRAGNPSLFCFGDTPAGLDDYAWWGSKSAEGNSENEKYAHRVGLKKPNAWGLYDMHGNVYEWCQDFYDEKYYAQSPPADPQGAAAGTARVARGGSWLYDAAAARSAARGKFPPEDSSATTGLRIVRELQ